MKIHELIEKLEGYNPDAEFDIIVNNRSHNAIILLTGSSEGCTKETADTVSFYIEELNTSEGEVGGDV